MPTFRITAPDGKTYEVTGPEGSTADQALEKVKASLATKQATPDAPDEPFAAKLGRQVLNAGAGAIRGAGSIGATILSPIDVVSDLIDGKGLTLDSNRKRRQAMDDALRNLGADTDSFAYGAGKLGAEVAGTLGAGGAIANTAARIPGVAAAVPNLLQSVRTAGMASNATGPVANLLTRTAGGAITGGVSAGMVDPEMAGTGAVLGGALPGASKLAGEVGGAVGKVLRGKTPSQEVVDLANRAKELGINIPADRIANSKPLNAVAATLNYMPFSGRAAAEDAMLGGMNRAVSRTFGQDSENVTMALRKAQGELGAKFDAVLQNNTVKMTPNFKTALAEAADQATSELGDDAASVIRKQVALIQTKGASGEIDGQAAYNIKKALDRIGNGNSDAAFYARDLKKKLMDALNESIGPQEAKAFAKVRQQYGNMLALENIAANGVERGISAGRLANMKNIQNADLQELADIAAKFLTTRESNHGALQRLVIGGGAAGAAGGLGALPMLPVAVGAGRATNALLNSNAARSLALGQPMNLLGSGADAAPLFYASSPVVASPLIAGR